MYYFVVTRWHYSTNDHKSRSPYWFCRNMFPSAFFVGLFCCVWWLVGVFFTIYKILLQFGTYKCMCSMVFLSGSCTGLCSRSTCSCCPGWPLLPSCPRPHQSGIRGWGSPLLLCWLCSMPHSLFSLSFWERQVVTAFYLDSWYWYKRRINGCI